MGKGTEFVYFHLQWYKKSTQNEHKAAKPWRNRRSFQMSKHAHKARCHSGGSTLTGFHGVLPNGELRVWTIALYSTSAVNDRHTYECQMIKISACFGCFRMMKYWAKTTWMLAKTLSILIKDLCFWMLFSIELFLLQTNSNTKLRGKAQYLGFDSL